MVQKRRHNQPNNQSPAPSLEVKLRGLLAWIRPGCLFLLGLLICWAILQPLDSTSVFDGSALPQNLGCLLLAVGVSLDLAVNQRSNRLTKVEAGCLIGIGLWMLIVTLNAAGMCNPRTGWNGFWHLLSILALYFSIRNLLVGTKLRSAALLILIGGATTLAGIGVFQVAIDFPRARAEYRADPEKVIAQLGIEAPVGSPMRQKLENRLDSPEPLATFALANSLAVLLSGVLVLTIGALAFRLMEHKELRSLSTWMPLTIIVLIGVVWFLTRSRIAFLSVPASIVLLVIGAYWQYGNQLVADLSPTTKRLLKRLTLLLVGSIVAGGVWLGWRDPLVLTEATKSLSYRIDYWLATFSMIKEHSLLGVGLGNFQTFYPRYMLASASETIADPHNWVLDLASTCSVPIAVVVIRSLATILIRKPVGSSRLGDSELESPEQSTDSTTSDLPLVLGSTIGGFIVLLGLMMFGLDDRTALAYFMAMLIATALCFSIHFTVRRFVEQTTLGPVTMALAMLLCLLVSGSWQATGLVVPLVCCLAASQVDSRVLQPQNNRWTTKLPLFLSAAVLVAFVWQSWSPVLKSNSMANRALTSASRQVELMDQAKRIDPYNSQWDRYRAELLVNKALAARDAAAFEPLAEEAIQAIDFWAEREPNSFLTGQFAGDRVLQLGESANRLGLDTANMRRRAVEFYAEAVKNRPTSVQLRVQLAYCLLMVGEKSAAENEIAEAQKLSDNTPHQDQKLAAQLVWIPGAPAELSPQTGTRPYCPAELVVAWIRSQLNP